MRFLLVFSLLSSACVCGSRPVRAQATLSVAPDEPCPAAPAAADQFRRDRGDFLSIDGDASRHAGLPSARCCYPVRWDDGHESTSCAWFSFSAGEPPCPRAPSLTGVSGTLGEPTETQLSPARDTCEYPITITTSADVCG
ncbi:MAG: hypothetical protein ACXWUG_15565 [Polyangiales bacterium]